MEWMNELGNMDNVIHNICIKDSNLIVYIKLWNEEIKQITFLNYYCFKEKNSIGREIGDIKVQTNSNMLDELKQDILDSDGSVDEISSVRDIVFCDAWNETILLEVLAEDMNVKSLNTKD